MSGEKITNTAMDMLDLIEKRPKEEIDQVLVIATTESEEGTNIFICSTCDVGYQTIGLLEWAKEIYNSSRSIEQLDDDSDE